MLPKTGVCNRPIAAAGGAAADGADAAGCCGSGSPHDELIALEAPARR